VSTSSTCPVCGRAVDALRARAVGVKDGKIVAYCSAECQAKAEGKPRVVEDRDLDVRVTVRTPPKGMPAVDSGPIIEVIREPSTPVAASGDGKAKDGKDAAKDAKDTKDAKEAKEAKEVAKPAESAKDTREPKQDAGEPKAKAKTPPAGTPVAMMEKVASGPTRPLPVPDVAKGSIPIPKDASSPALQPTLLPKKKRLDTDTRSMQPPEDYDDSDLGPPSDAEAERSRPPILVIVLIIIIAAVAATVALKLN
jgi:hypothetical protein